MNRSLRSPRFFSRFAALLAVLLLSALGLAAPAAAQQVGFSSSELQGVNLGNPTSVQFGPDGRLYVSQQNGQLKAFAVQRDGTDDYAATSTEVIGLVQDIPNHDDDGTLAPGNHQGTRQVTGIAVTGTATNPVLYVSSSDPRIGAGGGGHDSGLDTNSGIISKLTCPGGVTGGACQGGWEMVHLVRGLPRSEENHANNGMQLDEANGVLLVAQGGHANAGAPSNNFAFTTEYALSAAILEVDLEVIEAMPTQVDSEGQAYKYDLPTLDDPDRPGAPDAGDPFGGNNGLNMAKIVEGGPVQVYSPGYRNPYDLVLTEGGQLYVVDNGANGGWGGLPQYEESNVCTNKYLAGEPGSSSDGPDPSTYPAGVALLEGSDGQPDEKVNNNDNLHYVPQRGYYAGHPNPIRANPVGAGLYTRDGSDDNTNVFRNSTDGPNPLPADWPAVPSEMANPVECDYRQPGVDDGALYTWGHSTNGLTEYTASNFGGAMQGDLLAAGFNGTIHRLQRNSAGDGVTNEEGFASSFGSKPLDVIAQGDDDVFGGTVWAATYGSSGITVFEPSDYEGGEVGTCSAAYDPALDSDDDGYDNADEIDNGTNPCSAADKPADFDGNFVSDLNDSDDDGDGLADSEDPFAIDAENGLSTHLPVEYELFNNDPGFGFGGTGFTGLMANGSDYLELFDPDNDLIIGGTSGLFTNPSVGEGDTYESDNSQVNALQFGVDASTNTGPFTVEAQINGPFGGIDGNYASQGIYIGLGDQDNYLKVVLNSGASDGGFQVLIEEEGLTGTDISQNAAGLLDASGVVLYLSVDPAASTVQAKYAADGGPVTDIGAPVAIPASWLSPSDEQGLAVGFVSTSVGGAPEFAATWDYVDVTRDPVTAEGAWTTVADVDETRHENAFVQAGDKFYLLGGRESNTVRIYDPAAGTWSDGAEAPIKLHHFQAVEHDGLIYAVGAMTGNCCAEPPVEHVYIYDPVADAWSQGAEIPANRRRGGGGAVVYNDKIYLVSGNTNGHTGPVSAQFDVFDPATGVWTALSDIPTPRDHFFATVADGKLYAIGGRASNQGDDGDIFDDTVAEVDVYDFASESWSTLPDESSLPTPRAAAATGLVNGEIVVAGGESSQADAHADVEAFDAATQTWRTLAPMQTPRHATQGIVSNGGLYVAAGSPSQGGPGSAQLPLEAFHFSGETSPGGTPLAASTLEAPATSDLGVAAPGASTSGTVVLENTGGDQALLIKGVSLSENSAFALSETFAGPVALAPGGTLDLGVTFTPPSEGPATATLAIAYGAGQTLDVTLEGEGSNTPLARVNAGGASFAGVGGPPWNADQYSTGGETYENAVDIAGTEDDALYQTERYGGEDGGSFSYHIPVSGDEALTARLHFAELYQGVENNQGAGARVFDVMIEGEVVLDDYDIVADVGPATAVVKTFENVTDADGNGTLDVSFSSSVDNAKVSAIEVAPFDGEANAPPQLDAIANRASVEGDDVSNAGLAVVATDPDDAPDSLTYTITGQPAGVDIEPTNGQVIGTIANGAAAGSPYEVTVSVSDGADQASTSFAWTVTPAGGGQGGTAPALASIADQTGTEGASVSLPVEASAGGAGALTYSATGLPPALSIDESTGLISGTLASGGAGGAFQESGGLAVIEAESGGAASSWAAGTSLTSYTGDGYLHYDGSDHFNNPGQDVITYQVEVENPGTYQFQWRSQAGGSSTTEENDAWLKIDADAYYGQKGDGIVCPKGYDPSQNDCTGGSPEGAGGGGWFKVYVNSTGWSWQTSTSDNDPHDLFARFDQAGTYTIQVSGRSVEYVIDRMVMHRTGPGSPAPGNPTNTALAESQQAAGAAAGSPYDVTVTATGANDQAASESFSWTVAPAGSGNEAPVLAAIGDQRVDEGAQLDVTLTATDADGDVPSFEGTDLPAFASLTDNGDGTALLTAAPAAGDAGTYTLTATVADGQGGTDSESFALTVTDPAATATVVARVNAGGAQYTDGEGRAWDADQYFTGGETIAAGQVGVPADLDVAGTEDDALYQTERYGGSQDLDLSYNIPLSGTGSDAYTLNLLMAEIYQGVSGNASASCPGEDCAGQRVFDVMIEGEVVLDDYDIAADVGTATAVTKTFVGLTDADGNGTLDVSFSASADNAKVSAIEVLGGSSAPASTPRAFVTVNQGANLGASTYNEGEFQIANTGDVDIASVSFDLSTALLPDVVFDPEGTAGDVGAKCFTADSGTDAVGLTTDGSGSGSGSCVAPFGQPHNGTDGAEGYDQLTVAFSDFQGGETFGFSIDIDPTSIRGDSDTGDAGSISGLEMTGASVTVTFADGASTTLDASLFEDGSLGGGEAVVAPDAPAAPSIAVQGVTAPAAVPEAGQAITVTGPAGAAVELLQLDARLYIDDPATGGGYDVDPFEANEAIAKELYTATLDESGEATIDVTLLESAPSEGPGGGLNHFVAAVEGAEGQMSRTSNALVLEYGEEAVPSEAPLAGAVTYYDGRVLSGAELTLAGDGITATDTSDAEDGSYALSATTGASYTLSAAKTLENDTDAAEGVTTLDLSLMRRSILGIAPMEASYASLAADVNASGNLSTKDLALTRQLILGLRSDFGDATPEAEGLWQCVTAGGPDSLAGASYAYDPLTGAQTEQDFHCFRRGDVDASWKKTPSTSAPMAAAQTSAQHAAAAPAPVQLFVEEQTTEVSISGGESLMATRAAVSSTADEDAQTVVVPVKARNFRNVGGVQFTLTWDPEAMTYGGLEALNLPGLSQANFGVQRAEEGRLAVAWAHPQAESHSLSKGEALFAVRFKLKDDAPEEQASVGFSSEVTPMSAHRATGQRLYAVELQGESGSVEAVVMPEEFTLRGNYPNPFRSRTTLAFDLPEAADVTLEMYDVLGRRVMQRSAHMAAGAGKKMQLEAGSLSSGVYLYRLTAETAAGTQVKTGRLTLVR